MDHREIARRSYMKRKYCTKKTYEQDIECLRLGAEISMRTFNIVGSTWLPWAQEGYQDKMWTIREMRRKREAEISKLNAIEANLRKAYNESRKAGHKKWLQNLKQ